jgi:hypothetical protein
MQTNDNVSDGFILICVAIASPSPLLVSQLCKQLNTQFSNGDMREVQEVYLTRIVSEIMKYVSTF